MDCEKIDKYARQIKREGQAIRNHIKIGSSARAYTDLDMIEHLIKLIREELGGP